MKILLSVLTLIVALGAASGARSRKWKTKQFASNKKPSASTCFLANCKKCHSNQFSCAECNRGHVKVQVPLGYACWRQCPPGFQNVKGTCVEQQDCPKNCEKCSNRFSCSACGNGYALLKRFFISRCFQKCPRGYKKVTNREGGSKCVEACSQNCKACQNKFSCSVCEDGYSLFRGFASPESRCFSNCPNGYKKEMNPSGGYKCVKKCTSNCNKCRNRFSCAVCEDGYSLFSLRMTNRCVKNCPKGYKPEGSLTNGLKCTKECQVPNCGSCPKRWGVFQRPNRCERCKPGYYKLTVGNKPWQQHDFCFSHCPSGYMKTDKKGVPVCVKGMAIKTQAATEPTTEEPSVWSCDTEFPTTQSTTEEPTTEEPKTEEPTTEEPTTEAPATEALANEAPATEAPATEAPATESFTSTEPTITPEPSIDTDFWP